jgi:hypothetical protein
VKRATEPAQAEPTSSGRSNQSVGPGTPRGSRRGQLLLPKQCRGVRRCTWPTGSRYIGKEAPLRPFSPGRRRLGAAWPLPQRPRGLATMATPGRGRGAGSTRRTHARNNPRYLAAKKTRCRSCKALETARGVFAVAAESAGRLADRLDRRLYGVGLFTKDPERPPRIRAPRCRAFRAPS